MIFASGSFFELSQWWTVIWKSKSNKPFPSLSCFWSEYLITATEENPHCPLLPGRCVCQPSFTRRNNSRQISASLHNHQRTQGQNNYTLKSQERNANWDVKKNLSTVKKVGIYFYHPSSYLRHVFSITFFILWVLIMMKDTDAKEWCNQWCTGNICNTYAFDLFL